MDRFQCSYELIVHIAVDDKLIRLLDSSVAYIEIKCARLQKNSVLDLLIGDSQNGGIRCFVKVVFFNGRIFFLGRKCFELAPSKDSDDQLVDHKSVERESDEKVHGGVDEQKYAQRIKSCENERKDEPTAAVLARHPPCEKVKKRQYDGNGQHGDKEGIVKERHILPPIRIIVLGEPSAHIHSNLCDQIGNKCGNPNIGVVVCEEIRQIKRRGQSEEQQIYSR